MSELLLKQISRQFPILHRLRQKRGQIPYRQQTAATDCGAACLCMLLAHHGKDVSLDEVRATVGIGRDGAEALNILRAARWYGFVGRGVKVSQAEDVAKLPAGSILHWNFRHYVVYEGKRGASYDLIDPARGRVQVSAEELSKYFTGVALVLEPGDSFTQQHRAVTGIRRYLQYLLQQRETLVKIVVTSFVLQMLALAVPILTGIIVDQIVPRADISLLRVIIIGLTILLIFRFAAALLRSHLLIYFRTRLDIQSSFNFLHHMMDLPYKFFQQRSAGDLMTRLHSNADIRDILTTSTLSALLDGSSVIIYLIVLLIISGPLGWATLALGSLRIGIFLLTRRRFRELTSDYLQAQAASHGYQVNMLQGIETLKASGAEERALGLWSRYFVREAETSIRQAELEARINAVLESLTLASPLIILCIGAHLVLSGELSLGTMLALNTLAMGFLQPLTTLIKEAYQLQRLGSYIERINDVMDSPKEQQREETIQPGRLSGRIELQDVSFGYSPHARPVIRNVSLNIQPGQFIALVGPSGSGKSTLAALLMGLYQPSHGRVIYDGIDLHQYDLRALRQQLGIVTQQSALLPLSIRDNIALSQPNASLDKVVEAARQACIHDDIIATSLGYQMALSDQGASLSGGQRQRLVLARALFQQPRILLLDEATSALDNITEQQVYQELRQLNATRIVIAHRLSSVRQADLIVVMQDGEIVEQGKHEDLLAQGGVYARLANSHSSDKHSNSESGGGKP